MNYGLGIRNEKIFLRSYNLTVLRSFLLLCSFAFLLFACDSEDIPVGKPDGPVLPPESEKIAVTFSVSEMGFGDNEALTPRQASSNHEKTVAIPLTDDICMYATLTEEQASVRLRAKVSLEPGTKVRIVAYIILSSDTICLDHADYTVFAGNILNPVTDPLTVYPGLPYKFVAYSYNNADPMPPFSDTTPPILNGDILWGDTIATVPQSQPPFHLNITMQHKRSKVVINATADFGSTNTLNRVDAAMYCYDNPVLNVQTGALNSSGGLTWSPFSWTITNPLLPAQASDTLYVLTGEETDTRLRINQMRINYLTFNDPLDIIYDRPLEGGKSYVLKVHFMWARGGSADRITWDDLNGKYVITRDPTDAGLYFKFGSVVGLFNDVDPSTGEGRTLTLPGQTDNSYVGFVGPRDVAWHPFASDFSSWIDTPGGPQGVPAYESTDYPTHQYVTPENGYHTVANVIKGKGDPCRLVGMDLNKIKTYPGTLTYTDIDNGIWRLPTFQENIWFTEKSDNVSTSLHFWDLAGGAFPSPFGPGVAGGEFPARPNTTIFSEGRKSRFLPAAGCREDQIGDVSRVFQGTFGYYWSNQPVSSSSNPPIRGNSLLFFSNAITLYVSGTQNPESQNINWGFSVRCVRQTLNIEVSTEPWEEGGNLNVGNEGNVKL